MISVSKCPLGSQGCDSVQILSNPYTNTDVQNVPSAADKNRELRLYS